MILQTEQNMEQFVETIDKFYQYIWNNIDKENKTKLFKAATESLEFLNDTELSNLPIFWQSLSYWPQKLSKNNIFKLLVFI